MQHKLQYSTTGVSMQSSAEMEGTRERLHENANGWLFQNGIRIKISLVRVQYSNTVQMMIPLWWPNGWSGTAVNDADDPELFLSIFIPVKFVSK